jgi:biopolymer transport protein ExbB
MINTKTMMKRMAGVATIAVVTLMPVAIFAQDAAETSAEEKFGFMGAMEQGGPVAWATFGIMAIMSVLTWYIMITKFFEQRTILNHGEGLDKKFWGSNSISEGASKLEKDSAFRQVIDDGLRAAAHHDGKLTDKIDQHEWISMSLDRSVTAINSKLQGGLAFLATVGSTAPFIGLFGTVVGIYRALIEIARKGEADIAVVAGPVGEALIMTAIGLFVAVPAVMGYNWLIRRNKAVMEKLGNFSNDIHAFMLSGARVAQPVAAAATAAVKK